MKITRRDFLRASAAMSGALALRAAGLMKLQEALAAEGAAPPVIWLQGQGCTGCSVSLLNSIHYTTIDDLLINTVDMKFNSTVMAAAGDLAVEAAEVARNAGGYVLIIEGAIPSGANGEYCHLWEGMTMMNAIEAFAPGASVILSVGTCAAYGGLSAGSPNPTEAMGVDDALNHLGLSATVINIPGCPVHPDWLVGTVAALLNGQMPELDEHGRPIDFFPKKEIHEDCPLKDEDKVHQLGEQGCLKEIGCKGPDTHADCHIREWNSPASGEHGVNWCIGASSPCIGCTEPDFPDGMSPFYELRDSGGGGDPGGGDPGGGDETITIRKAEYRADRQELKVEANSSKQPDAKLTVVGYGEMTWKADKNKYEYKAKPVAAPGETVTVVSSFGGSVTTKVTYQNVDGGGDPGGGVETIMIRKAEYRADKQELKVEATSSNQPEAKLTVAGYGAMIWKADKNKYEYKAKPVASPGETVTVISSLGSLVTVEVTYKNVDSGADIITIRKAEYRVNEKELRVEATSSKQPDAKLTVEGYGVMTWKADKNKYEYRIKPISAPESSIVVKSGLGGVAAKSVYCKD